MKKLGIILLSLLLSLLVNSCAINTKKEAAYLSTVDNRKITSVSEESTVNYSQPNDTSIDASNDTSFDISSDNEADRNF